MVEMSTSGSGEGPGEVTTRGYSTAGKLPQRPGMGTMSPRIRQPIDP